MNKLEIEEVTSLKSYIITIIKIYKGLQNMSSIKEDDISSFDAAALNELKQYINDDLKNYINSLRVNYNKKMICNSSNIECLLKHGKLYFYFISRNNSIIDTITIRFESYSTDQPVLEISNIGDITSAFYTYKFKSKHYRFMDPSVKTICDIKGIVDMLSIKNLNKSVSLQVA